MKSYADKVDKEKIPKYPYLGVYSIDKDFIVLFNEEDCGVVIFSNNLYHDLGIYRKDWDEEDFEKYEGEITLSN